MTQGAILFSGLQATATQEHTATQARRCVKASCTHTHTHDTRHTTHRAQSILNAAGKASLGAKRSANGAAPARRVCAVTRQCLPAGRARIAAHPIRRPQGARPRPRPLSSPSGLRLRLGDLALLSPPQNAPSSGARAQRRAAGREGRAGVRPCVRLRQRARRRESERGKGGSGPGGSASCGYVAELGGSGSSFAAIAAT